MAIPKTTRPPRQALYVCRLVGVVTDLRIWVCKHIIIRNGLPFREDIQRDTLIWVEVCKFVCVYAYITELVMH